MSLFGAQNKPAGSSLFSFGASTAQPQNQTGNIFNLGTQGTQSVNTQQQQPQQQQQPTAFGQVTQNSFGQTQNSSLGSSLWQPGGAAPRQKPIPEQIQTVVEKWDPANPNCAFKHYFYNKVDESRIPYYQPSATEDAKEWEEALQNKPAPGFIPVMCAGFQALAERLKVQTLAIGTFNAKLHEINASLDAILSRHDLDTSIRSLAARRRHAELSKRCLALAAKVQVLRNRGYSLSGDEDDLKQKLQEIERGMQDPALSARMEELWSRLIVLRNYAEALKAEISKRGEQPEEVLGEEIETKAKKILEDYEKQLQHLRKELEVVKTDLDTWEKEQGPLPSGPSKTK